MERQFPKRQNQADTIPELFLPVISLVQSDIEVILGRSDPKLRTHDRFKCCTIIAVRKIHVSIVYVFSIVAFVVG
jgi:hypothetical protein